MRVLARIQRARCESIACAVLLAAGLLAEAHAVENISPNPPGSAAVVLYPDPPDENPLRTDVDEYGGWLGLKGQATGYFHTEKIGPRWWLITPAGHAFFGLGVRDIPHDGKARRLRNWGFNCAYVGAERPATADDGLPYMLNLKFIRLAKREIPLDVSAGMPPWFRFFDVFDPEWIAACEAYAEERLKPHANDPLMVGFWIDNEVSFHGWYNAATRTEPGSPARRAFLDVARAYYADQPGQFEKDWEKCGVKSLDELAAFQGRPAEVSGLAEAWENAVAEQTFGTIHRITRAVDPNHLNLGVRMVSNAPPPPAVFKALGKYCDVVSLNLYSVLSDRLLSQIFTMVPMLSAVIGKPIMVSEFSYRGGDTRCPNTLGAPPTVATQAERGIGYLSYVSAAASIPCFVGVNWYTYDDDPAERRWDEYGEDCNFGIVDNQERPYAALTAAMRVTNAAIYELAADPVQKPDCPVFWRTELMRWERNWNQEFLKRYARLDEPFPDPLADQLPADRRYHENYWVRHESPNLIVNDGRFLGDCQANLIRKREGGHQLMLLGLRYFTSFPRALWVGNGVEAPGRHVVLEGNPQVLIRDIDDDGRVRRMTMVDGSFVRLDFSTFEFRTNAKVAYLDLRYDHGAKRLTIISRGTLAHLGLRGVTGWQAAWNDTPVLPVDLAAPEGMTVFACPE